MIERKEILYCPRRLLRTTKDHFNMNPGDMFSHIRIEGLGIPFASCHNTTANASATIGEDSKRSKCEDMCDDEASATTTILPPAPSSSSSASSSSSSSSSTSASVPPIEHHTLQCPHSQFCCSSSGPTNSPVLGSFLGPSTNNTFSLLPSTSNTPRGPALETGESSLHNNHPICQKTGGNTSITHAVNSDQHSQASFCTRCIDTSCNSKNNSTAGNTICKVCWSETINCVFIRCGHMAVCISCSDRLDRCPICRAEIEDVIQTYYA